MMRVNEGRSGRRRNLLVRPVLTHPCSPAAQIAEVGSEMRPFLRKSLTSKALLFAPAALLCLLAATAAQNSYARTVLRAEDSPDKAFEAVVYVLYSPLYPFAGEVRAFVELRRLPDHQPLLTRSLGAHRWCSQAMDSYRAIEWSGPGRITLRSTDGKQSHLVLGQFPPQAEDPPEGRRG